MVLASTSLRELGCTLDRIVKPHLSNLVHRHQGQKRFFLVAWVYFCQQIICMCWGTSTLRLCRMWLFLLQSRACLTLRIQIVVSQPQRKQADGDWLLVCMWTAYAAKLIGWLTARTACLCSGAECTSICACREPGAPEMLIDFVLSLWHPAIHVLVLSQATNQQSHARSEPGTSRQSIAPQASPLFVGERQDKICFLMPHIPS